MQNESELRVKCGDFFHRQYNKISSECSAYELSFKLFSKIRELKQALE